MSFNGVGALFIQAIESDQDERLMGLLRSWYHISVPDNNDHNDRLVWCLEHCQGKFRDIGHFDTRIWYFEKEQDAALFALKWT